jgi:methionyl-tRNA formyltransferase
MNILFFGTPHIAVPFLQWLDEHHTVVGVVCQPDKPAGRGYDVQPPPTKIFAEQRHIPVFQPAGKWEESTVAQLKKIDADIGVAVAYGRIMPEPVYQTPKLGTINVHFSLLPKYRGAAPMQWALVNGEKETGVSVFWLVKEMDAGPIFHQAAIPLAPEDDARALQEKLIQLGITVLSSAFNDLAENRLIKAPQTGTPTMAPLIKKEDGRVVWAKNAEAIVNLVRGFSEWPVAYTEMPVGKRLKIQKAAIGPGKKGEPGKILSASEKEGIVIHAGEGTVALLTVQPEGKKAMPAWAFWQGGQLKIGDTLK